MKAIILAGGKGTRLQSVVSAFPKPMAPVHNHPFLEYLISKLVSSGITDIILSVGYLHEKIEKYFRDGRKFNVSIAYCVEGEPLGTGGAVRESMKLTGQGNTLVINGDTYVDYNLTDFLQFHQNSVGLASLLLIPVDKGERYGSVVVSPDGIVQSFAEKAESGASLVNAGVYLFNESIVDMIPSGNVSLESYLLPLLVQQRQLAAQIQNVAFIDIGIPEDYDFFCKNITSYVRDASLCSPGYDRTIDV